LAHSSTCTPLRRTSRFARRSSLAQASNLVEHIVRSLQQAAKGKRITRSAGKPSDRALFLIGHDTNLTTVSGLLGLTQIADGRRDDTPPGGALAFELWKDRKSRAFSVRTYFTVQTIEQMRTATELTLAIHRNSSPSSFLVEAGRTLPAVGRAFSRPFVAPSIRATSTIDSGPSNSGILFGVSLQPVIVWRPAIEGGSA
jgi:hypothetical protein